MLELGHAQVGNGDEVGRCTKPTCGALGLLQQAKRAARGLRTSTNFIAIAIAIAYLRMSKLKHLPAHPFAPPRTAQ